MDLKLQVKQTQALSQRMIQSAEILQMTSQELNTYIRDRIMMMIMISRAAGTLTRTTARPYRITCGPSWLPRTSQAWRPT